MGQDVHQDAASVVRRCLDVVSVDPGPIGDYGVPNVPSQELWEASSSVCGQTELPRVVLASAALRPIPRPSVVVARATTIPSPLAVDVHH